MLRNPNADGQAAKPAPSYVFNSWVPLAEADQQANAKLRVSSEGRLGTDPFAFICGSIFFTSPRARTGDPTADHRACAAPTKKVFNRK